MRKRNAVKKIAAVLASACLIVSMLATTVMAKPAESTKTGSLTVTASSGDLKDYTFDLYRVADITVGTDGIMSYTATTDFSTALKGKDLTDQTAVEATLKELVKAAEGKTATKTTGKIASAVTSQKIDELSLGYYLVKVSAPNGVSATGDFLVSIPSTKADGTDLNYNVEVKVKTSTVTIEKKGEVQGATAGEKTVKVGDKIDYTLTMKVPDTTGFSKYVYKVTDTMGKGLKFDENSLKVYVGDLTTLMVAGNYNLTHDTDSTTGKTTIGVNFNDTLFVKAGGTGNPDTYPAGTPLKITYSATVTKDAITTGKDGVSNTAKLEFSNKPGSEGTGSTGETPAPEKPTFYTFNIKVDKTFAPALADANDAKKVTFKLKDVKVKEVTAGTAGAYIVDPNGTDMDLKLADGNTLSVSGLAAGTYYLDETATVPGYNLLKSTIKIVISPTYGANGELNGYTANTSKIDIDNQNTVTVSVENKKGFTLPSTGGQGMVALVAAGICLMAAMAALMVSYMRKRRNA